MNGQVISNCGTSRSSRRTLLILAGFASICCGAPCPSTAYAQQPPVRALQSEATNAAAVAPAKLSSGNALLRTAAIRNDATINAMQFLDARRGWAVGDRGSIWSTSDGGKQWHLYPVDVTASLHSVHFIDSQTGWVAGGETDPLTHVSRGVLLMTSDGGRTWSRSEKAVLPEIHKIHFRDRQNGWAAGCTAYHFGSGLFYTVNGGRDWLPIVGETSSEYLCADFSDNRLALLADVRGNVQLVERGAITASIPVQRGLQRARAIHADVRGGSWLVGDGGLCQFSYDSGKSWQAPAGWPTAGLPQRFDLTALAVRGSKIWIAGVPGSKVFHSTDAGRNWSVLSTGQTLPLTSICFVDDQTGWAAGALGTILHTTDGGKSWTTQHSGGQRVGMLAIYSEAADVPFELVARTAGSDGYTTALLTLNRRDLELPEVQSAFVDSLRASQAINNLTGTTAKPAWQFPLRQRGIEQGPETIKQVWEQVSPTSLEEYLVMQLRSWRPDVVLTHDAKSGANRTAQLAINQTVLSAVEKAADPTQYADQLKQLSLPVWQVSKVFAEAKEPSADGMQFASVQLAPVIGQSFAEWSTSSRRLTGQDHDAPPMIHLSKLIDRVPQTAGRADLFAGLTTSGLGINRRDAVPVLEVAAVNRRAAEKRRNMQAILLRENRDGAPRVHWLAQVNDLTTSLDENSAASLLYELAERYYQTGNWEVAAETFELLVQRYPTAECSASARLWLLHYFSSTEVAWRLASTQKRVAQDTGPLAESKSESAFQPTDFVLKTVYENPPDARSATAGIDTAPTEIVSFPTMVEKRQLMAVA
ncbi:MAG: YCF48-related protein, partial [Planctomycetota bacterium]|nr:YCF48-related protein [Planctomycetota bacterium]